MTLETNNIYSSIAQVITTSIEEDWTKAVLRIEYLPKRKGYKGHYFDQKGEKKSLQPRPPFELAEALDQFYALTTEGGNNRWNHLYFTLHPDKQFEVNFIWDEDFAEIMAYINSTMDVPEPGRSKGLDRIKETQLERKTARIYDGIARVLLQNAPPHAWQQLVLTLTRPPLHYEAQAQTAPDQRTALLLLGEEAAVQALEELTANGDHLRWESATLTVEPTGQYRYSFVWAGAGEFNLPTRYHREGQVTLPSTAA